MRVKNEIVLVLVVWCAIAVAGVVVNRFWVRPEVGHRIRSGIGGQYYLDFVTTNNFVLRPVWRTNVSDTGFVYRVDFERRRIW